MSLMCPSHLGRIPLRRCSRAARTMHTNTETTMGVMIGNAQAQAQILSSCRGGSLFGRSGRAMSGGLCSHWFGRRGDPLDACIGVCSVPRGFWAISKGPKSLSAEFRENSGRVLAWLPPSCSSSTLPLRRNLCGTFRTCFDSPGTRLKTPWGRPKIWELVGQCWGNTPSCVIFRLLSNFAVSCHQPSSGLPASQLGCALRLVNLAADTRPSGPEGPSEAPSRSDTQSGLRHAPPVV